VISLTIYGKKGCCLCEEAKETIRRVQRDFPLRIEEVGITSDPRIYKRYRERIPVVVLQGQEVFRSKVHEITLRKKLEKILREGPPWEGKKY